MFTCHLFTCLICEFDMQMVPVPLVLMWLSDVPAVLLPWSSSLGAGVSQKWGLWPWPGELWGWAWGILLGSPRQDIPTCVSSLLWVCLFVIFMIKMEAEIPRGVFKSRRYFYVCWKWENGQNPPKENEHFSLSSRLQDVHLSEILIFRFPPECDVCPPSPGTGSSWPVSLAVWPPQERGDSGTQSTGRGIENQQLYHERKLNTFVK